MKISGKNYFDKITVEFEPTLQTNFESNHSALDLSTTHHNVYVKSKSIRKLLIFHTQNYVSKLTMTSLLKSPCLNSGRIYCHKFTLLSNCSSCYICKCIRSIFSTFMVVTKILHEALVSSQNSSSACCLHQLMKAEKQWLAPMVCASR